MIGMQSLSTGRSAELTDSRGAGRIRSVGSGELLRADENWTVWRIGLILLASAVYFGTPTVSRTVVPANEHFPQLAEAFLQGRLSINAAVAVREHEELIPSQAPDRYFCAYLPLPAILLMPFVAIFGGAVTTAAACRAVSVVSVLLFDLCLGRIAQLLGWPRIDVSARLLFNLLFAFGTVTWHNAHAAGDWHLAHAVTLAAGLLALHEYLGKNRAMVVGGFVAMITLSRPTAALAGLFFLLPLIRAGAVGKLLQFAVLPVAAIVLLGAYNAARFGDPTDFGYSRMILSGTGRELMDAYGQFQPHYISRNFYWFFLAPPWVRSGTGWPIGFDPRGMSLFIACPAMLYVFPAIRRGWEQAWVRDAVAAIAVTLVPLLLYFNTGFWQLGHRFSMDYMTVLMVLVVAGIGFVPSRLAIGQVTLSILIQTVGVLAQPVARLPPWLAP